MKLSKRIIAFVTAVTMSICLLSFNAFAADDKLSLDVIAADDMTYVNWTSDCGNGPMNGSTNGSHGSTTYSFAINGSTTNFNATWQTKIPPFNNIQGVGWSTGKASRKVGYNMGVFNHTGGSTGCTWLELYGWTRNSLIEYSVYENWVNYVPNDGTKAGTLSTDGAAYTYYYKNANGPNIDGNGPFKQVISIRDSKKTSGTITLQNHVNAWNSNPSTKLGTTWANQAFCVEGYDSKGSANGSVWVAN